MVTNPDWPAFLAARLSELQYDIEAMEEGWRLGSPEYRLVLADIEAKRAIIRQLESVREVLEELHEDHFQAPWYELAERELEAVVENLSRPFSDHPDYPGEPNIPWEQARKELGL